MFIESAEEPMSRCGLVSLSYAAFMMSAAVGDNATLIYLFVCLFMQSVVTLMGFFHPGSF